MKKKFEEMNSYDKLVAEHNYKVEALQRDCPHVDSEWITRYYMWGGSYDARMCKNCNKELETKGKIDWNKVASVKTVNGLMRRKLYEII